MVTVIHAQHTHAMTNNNNRENRQLSFDFAGAIRLVKTRQTFHYRKDLTLKRVMQN